MLDLRQFEALVALSRHRTVSAAAQVLGYSQPTVSHHLAALSRSTGAVLLLRSGRGVRLTREGQVLAARGEESLGLMDRAEREARAMARAEAGRIRLAAFPSAAASFVPDVLAVLGERSPGLVVDLVDSEPPEALEALVRGRVDAALSFSYPEPFPRRTSTPSLPEVAGAPHREEPEDCHHRDAPASRPQAPGAPRRAAAGGPRATETVPLGRDRLYLVTSPGSVTSLEEGAQCRWITGCARCHEKLAALGRAAGFELEVAYASDDYVAAQALVAAGVGATLLPGMALRAYRHPAVHVSPVPGEARDVEIVVDGSRPRPAAVRAVVGRAFRRLGTRCCVPTQTASCPRCRPRPVTVSGRAEVPEWPEAGCLFRAASRRRHPAGRAASRPGWHDRPGPGGRH